MQTSLPAIATAARRDLNRRFRGLYSMLNRANFEVAFHELRKNAAAGEDEITWHSYAQDLSANLLDLECRLKEKRYRAKLVKRVFIPKNNGKLRPLGIPALEDKIVQYVVREILQTLFEPLFKDCSYAYRPNRSARQAALKLQDELRIECKWVVECDIAGFFDNVSHDWMLKMLERRINDRSLLELIRKWLRAGIMQPNGAIEYPEWGTPQGSIISPILANIYLHYVLDHWFEQEMKKRTTGRAILIRYADDFVAGFKYHTDAQRFFSILPQRLKKFGLTLAEDKSRKLRFNRFRKEESEAFDFLGFEYRWVLSRKGKDIIRLRTSSKKFRKIITDLKVWIKKHQNKRLWWVLGMIKAKLRGLYNYFGVIGNSSRLHEMYIVYRRTLFQLLNRRSQRKSFNYNTFTYILNQNGIVQYRSGIFDTGIQMNCLSQLA
jgi:group II intron reverse transcriptase/maturase